MLTRILYTLLLALASPLLLFKLYQKKQGKPTFGRRWKEHFGVTPTLINKQVSPIWVHAVSVGESIAIAPLVKKLKIQHPNIPIVITTTTSTGAEQVNKLGDLVEHRYMPIDFAWCVRGFIKQIKPRLMVIVETELWPNTLDTVNRKNIPIIVVNARLSARSAQGYQKFSFVWKLIANNINHFLCLHEDDASRFIALGINKEKVSITGSLKYDITIPDQIDLEAKALRKQLGEMRPIIIAASTHKGEDNIILSAFKTLKLTQPATLLILVPRHPERFTEVELLCKAEHFSVIRRTRKQVIEPHLDIYLADTMGEMLLLMATADIVFMGGSLLGDKVGGHNFIEPAALAKPIISGESYYNFADIGKQLSSQNAIKICANENLSDAFEQLISDNTLAKKMGKSAQQIVFKNQGALQKSLSVISHYLNQKRAN